MSLRAPLQVLTLIACARNPDIYCGTSLPFTFCYSVGLAATLVWSVLAPESYAAWREVRRPCKLRVHAVAPGVLMHSHKLLKS